MSKAFTRESDQDEEDEPEVSSSLPRGTPNYITPTGYQRLRDELEHLLKVERPKTVETVAWAASNGDRSENGDYIYGKRRLREIDRRLRFLTKRLEIAQVVDPALQQGNDQIFFGATVTLLEESGESQTYRIVGVDETDFSQGHISWISPLARALIKAREGDLVKFASPAGMREVEIEEVRYE
jgi:transcription elongation factor GreB